MDATPAGTRAVRWLRYSRRRSFSEIVLMDEFNPYAPPGARPPAPPADALPGLGVYRLVNWLYAALMLFCLISLLHSGTLRAEFHHLLVASIFLAPLLCFLLVMTRRAALFRRWYWVQALGTGWLFLLCLLDLTEGPGLRGIGVFMTAVNAAALFAGQHFLFARRLPGGAAAGRVAG